MSTGPASHHVRLVAVELLEHLRAASDRLHIENISTEAKASTATKRRAIYWLRRLGAPIANSNDGYRLENRDWQLPEGTEAPVVTVIKVMIEIPRPLTPEEVLETLTTGEILTELENRGFKPSDGFTVHKTLRGPAQRKRRAA